MNLQESIRRILREELLPRVRRRFLPDEMEKEFLESFDSAYRLTKDRKVLRAHFLDELIYTTISIMMDGYHWRFVSTLPEDEFWYDDIHTGLENHYKDRIIQMYNERDGINESILREENEGYKVKLVIRMIHSLYDEVSFIEQSTYNNKPLLKIYFNSDDTAANIESWFDEKVSRDIDEYTSGNIVACPSWMFDWDERKKNADVFIETELLKYDNLGNVINESILREETSSHNNNESRRHKVFYGFQGIPNFWSDDYDRVVKDSYFDDKDYNDYYFDNFYDMDKEFGHEDSLFGTKGLPVGHPNRSSKSFDMYNDQYGPAIVRVVDERDGINESILREEKETEFSTPFKRRLGRFTSFVWDNNAINYPCDFENFDSFIHGIHAEVMDMVSDGSDTDGPLSDWLTYIDAIRYIQRYMSDDLKEYYNRECVKKND